MFQLNLGMEIADFLNEYWQKKPLLIKQGFKHFTDPLTANELAGLAMEEEIESRIVSNANQQWQLETGPFEDYSEFGEQNWTLLVQAVDHWHPEAAKLIESFRFLPNWRIDDLMISFSTPGAGVGPHLDQYDVFIIQGEGKRHWRVGMPDSSLQQHCPHPRLLQVTPFQSCIDVIMEPGDILYIPPGCPHDGISIENSLNYSVGFRAPAQKDLITGLTDFLIEQEINGERFSDPLRQQQPSVGEITPQDLQHIKQLVEKLTSDPALLPQWFGNFITQPKHELNLTEPEPHYSPEEIQEYLDEGSVLARLGGLRTSYYRQAQDTLLFINGDCFPLPADEQQTTELLTDNSLLDQQQCLHFCSSPERLSLLTMLINRGYWYFEE